MKITWVILSGAVTGLVFGAVVSHCLQDNVPVPPDEGIRLTAKTAADNPDARAFLENARLLGYQVGMLNGYVNRCVPDWKNQLAGPAEITLFLKRMNTPKAVIATSLEAFAKGQEGSSGMACGDGKSSELSAGVIANVAADTIRELKRLAWVPAVLFHRGTKT